MGTATNFLGTEPRMEIRGRRDMSHPSRKMTVGRASLPARPRTSVRGSAARGAYASRCAALALRADDHQKKSVSFP